MTTRPAIHVALGERRYVVRHMAHDALAGISDIAVDGDRIIALRRRAPELQVMGARGSLRGEGHDLPQMACGHGLRRIAPGLFAAVDMDGHKLLFLDAALSEIGRIHCNERPGLGRPFNHPTDCARGPDGRFYVTDGYGNSAVHVFAPDFRHLHSFGAPGRGAGQFSTPHSVVVDGQGRVCIADRENDRVQRFDADGEFIDMIEGLHRPMALALLADGTLLATDQTPRLSAFDTGGRLTGRCRTFATYAHGMDVCADGTIVLAEMAPDRVTFLKPVAE